MHPIDLVLAASFALAWPLYGATLGRRFLQAAVATGTPGARRAAYTDTIFFQWMFAALAAAAALEHGLSAEALRLLPPVGTGLAVSVGALVLGLGLVVLNGRAATSPAGLVALRKAIQPLAWFLPQDRADRALFRPMSLTAGMVEEWLFRGWLLAVLTPLVGVAGAIAISCALFGMAHAYQGPGGIVKTGIVGLLFSGLAWATGSLWAPIVLHAAIDWMQGDLIVKALEEDPLPVAA
jgi:membrane protease YdiL (CAAX protease family)